MVTAVAVASAAIAASSASEVTPRAAKLASLPFGNEGFAVLSVFTTPQLQQK